LLQISAMKNKLSLLFAPLKLSLVRQGWRWGKVKGREQVQAQEKKFRREVKGCTSSAQLLLFMGGLRLGDFNR
jgi:hypothetical protein